METHTHSAYLYMVDKLIDFRKLLVLDHVINNKRYPSIKCCVDLLLECDRAVK